MNNYPLITCTILTYKKFQYIYAAIESVLIQDYPHIELIISDDFSGDFPEEKIRCFIQQHKKDNLKNFLIRVNEKNVGTVKHANNALQYAQGKYLVGLAHDDKFYETSTIRKIVDRLIKTDADILCCRRVRCTETELDQIRLVPEDSFLRKIRCLNTAQKQYRAFATGRFFEMFSGSSTYYKKDFLYKWGFFDESYILSEDYVIYLQYTRSGGIIATADDIISICYREGGISTGAVRNAILDNDDRRRNIIEVMPYLDRFNRFDQRYIKFLAKIPTEYQNSNFKRRLLFIFKYFDMCILSKCYKWHDKLLIRLRN